MNALMSKWFSMCDSLGVAPKQFSVLASGGLVAAIILGVKFTGGATKATAAPKPAPEPAAATARAVAPTATASTFQLRAWPARDPFTAFEAVPAEPAPAVATGSVKSGPDSLKLQATMDDGYAVINGRTIAVGGRVIDTASGQSFELTEVGFRRAVLQSGKERFEIAFER